MMLKNKIELPVHSLNLSSYDMHLLKRILTKSIWNGNCWIYLGWCNRDGYGVIKYHRTIDVKVHRFSAFVFHNLQLEDKSKLALHKLECENKNCWHPFHIYIGTDADNKRDEQDKRMRY